MPDYSFLLGAKPVDIPNPLDIAGKGATLADLLQRVQGGAMTLQKQQQAIQMMQDPRYIAALSQIASLGGGQSSAPGNAPGGGGAAGPVDLSFLGQYGLAGQEGFSQAMKLRQEGAAAQENIDKAARYRQENTNDRLALVAKAASAVADSPTQQNVQALQMAHEFSGAGPDAFGAKPTTGDPKDWQSYAGSVYTQLTDKKTREETAKTIVEAGLAPKKVAIEQQQANTAEAKQAMEYAKYLHGEPFSDQGRWYVRTPNPSSPSGWTIQPVPFGPAGGGAAPAQGTATPTPTPAPSAAGGTFKATLPAGFTPNMSDQQIVAAINSAKAAGKPTFSATGTDTNGKPVTINVPIAAAADVSQQTYMTGAPAPAPAKTGPDYKEQAMFKSSQDEVQHMIAASQAAAPMKAQIQDLRNTEAQGIFSGGIQGTEFFLKIANVLAAAGALSPEQYQTLAHTQKWDASTGQIIASSVSQFAGSRVAARELPFFAKIKGDLLQTAAGREEIYQHLWDISNRVQQQAVQADSHLRDPNNTSLLNFTPKFTDSKMPPITLNDLPDPRTWNRNKLLIGSDGTKRAVVDTKQGPAWKIVGNAPAPDAELPAPSQ